MNITKVSSDGRLHRRRLLAWYDRNRRHLPWRAAPGETPDPYGVWLSEIMLQQTTVAAVIPYYRLFTERWPDVAALAQASLDDVLVAWQGLGYYARARNLHKCAIALAEQHGGVFPVTFAGLLDLPGVGPYTAAAIAAIAFGAPEVVVDGNVERVVARLFAVDVPLPGAKKRLRELAAALGPVRPGRAARPGDYAQAMMDLGATVCTPRNPSCDACPLSDGCRAFAGGNPAAYPKRARKVLRPTRRGRAWFTVNPLGEILLRRRPEKGLLGGMMEVPSSPWRETKGKEPGDVSHLEAPVAADWRILPEPVIHVFTHFRLELDIAWVCLPKTDGRRVTNGGVWVARDALGNYALPSVMKKVCKAAFAAIDGI